MQALHSSEWYILAGNNKPISLLLRNFIHSQDIRNTKEINRENSYYKKHDRLQKKKSTLPSQASSCCVFQIIYGRKKISLHKISIRSIFHGSTYRNVLTDQWVLSTEHHIDQHRREYNDSVISVLMLGDSSYSWPSATTKKHNIRKKQSDPRCCVCLLHFGTSAALVKQKHLNCSQVCATPHHSEAEWHEAK